MAFAANISSIRKAAVLIRSLDADSAAQLLAQLQPAEARALRAAMRDLGAVDEQELLHVAAELQRWSAQTPSSPPRDQTAVVLELRGDTTSEKADAAGSSLESESRCNSQLAELRQLAAIAQSPTTPFQSLIATDSRALGEFLKQEHPQTVAVVLSYLPAGKAAEALSGLTDERQAEVVQRLAELGDTDADSLRVVEHSLEIWLTEQRREQLRRSDRMSIVGSILAATQDSTRQTILSRLKTRDCQLARQLEGQVTKTVPNVNAGAPNRFDGHQALLRQKCNATEANSRERRPTRNDRQHHASADRKLTADTSFAFENLAELPNQALTTLLRNVDTQLLHCACAGASQQLLERISGVLPRRLRKEFRNQLRSIGPIRLRDVEAAQQAIAQLAGRMTNGSHVKYPARQAI